MSATGSARTTTQQGVRAEPASPTRELAAFVAGLRFSDVPAAVVEKAKICVLDALGCMLFGSTLPWTRRVAEMALEQGGAEQASLIGIGRRASVTQAVLVNATAGHAFELDDAHTHGLRCMRVRSTWPLR